MTKRLTSFVYFIQAGTDGPIKIGRSVDVDARVKDLQSDTTSELHLLATIRCDASLEQELQLRFAAFKQNGEWFSPAPALLDFIASLPKDSGVPLSTAALRARLYKRAAPGTASSIDEVLSALLRNLPSADSRRAYAGDWAKYAAWLLVQGVDPLAATPKVVRDYVTHLHEVGLARTTVARRLSVVREVYGALVVDELMESNPAREVKNPKTSHVPRTPVLSEAQVEAMLCAPAETWTERRDAVCVALLFGLGWRRKEVAALTVEAFRDMTVTGVVKGGKTLTVGVPSWLMEIVEEWCERAGIEHGPLLPRSEKSARAMSGGLVYHAIRGVAVRAGVPAEVATPHALRRANITLGGERGVSLKARQLAVGHVSQSTTERYDRARDAAASAPGEVFADLAHRKRTPK